MVREYLGGRCREGEMVPRLGDRCSCSSECGIVEAERSGTCQELQQQLFSVLLNIYADSSEYGR